MAMVSTLATAGPYITRSRYSSKPVELFVAHFF